MDDVEFLVLEDCDGPLSDVCSRVGGRGGDIVEWFGEGCLGASLLAEVGVRFFTLTQLPARYL